MAAKPPGVLLVEGRDDREVVYQFCNRHGIANQSLFEVREVGGFDTLADELRVQPRASSDHAAVGAIFDADSQPESRWAAVRDALLHCGYADVPAHALPEGLVLPAAVERKRVGLWMMPDNARAGILEDFLQSLVSTGDTLLPHARQTVDALAEKRFKPNYHSKAVAHTWLAWQEEPGSSLGLALKRHYLDAHHPAALRLRNWLLRIFAPDASAPQPSEVGP